MTKERLIELWEEHVTDEFTAKDAQATIDTMCEDAYVNHVPTLAGGYGKEELLAFYSKDFIPVMPPDTTITPASRTVGECGGPRKLDTKIRHDPWRRAQHRGKRKCPPSRRIMHRA